MGEVKGPSDVRKVSSKGYASTIRKGTYVPHVSTWPALAQLAGMEIR